jgi:hypothetical protein
MARTATRKTAPKAVKGATMAPAHGKVRLRKNQSARSLLDLPADLIEKVRIEYGTDLQWIADQVLSKDEPAMRQDFEINAWEPVSQDMFDGMFDGMYMRKGQGGEIRYNGLVLMHRPYDLTIEARNEDIKARNDAMRAQERMVKGGVIPGMSEGFEPNHPTAIPKNIFNRSIHAPMDIPTE